MSFEYIIQQIQIAFVQLYDLESETIAYVALLCTACIVLDGVLMALKHKKKSSGLLSSTERAISIDGTEKHEARTYVSEVQGLAGRPDAVIIENGYFIPVERKPLTNKVRDRYISQLLVYMRLIEEFEGKRPPYGYLIVGKGARKVKIHNSEKRQEWLTEQLVTMRAIVEGRAVALPSPFGRKCKRCKVKEHCAASLAKPEKQDIVAIGDKRAPRL